VLSAVAGLAVVAVWCGAIVTGVAGLPLVSVLLGLTGLAVIVALVRSGLRAQAVRRRRLAALASWAAAHGWTLRRIGPQLEHRWYGPPFDHAGRRLVTEVLHRSVDGRPVVSFTYLAGGALGDHPPTWHVVVVDLPAVLPHLSLLLETTASTVADAVGVRDLQVESAAFNRARLIGCEDARYAHAVLHPRAIDLLLTGPLRDRPVRIEGSAVLTWAPGPTDVDQVIPIAEALSAFAGTIPRHVLDDHGLDPEAAEAR
jgi:hypothetical protein